MKYDRPVWQLMHACADALPESFRLDDVRSWFAEHFPEVGDATIRAHVVGLTEGGAKHPQFQRRSPLFRRVERGVYSPIPFDERGELPEDNPDDDAAAPVRFKLVGPPDDDEEPADDKALATPPVEDEPEVEEVADDQPEAEGDDQPDADADAEDEGDNDSEVAFWPPPADEPSHSDAMAQAAAARRKRREKDDRRLRKAAKREAKRRTEAEAEHARRTLGSTTTGQFDPEFAQAGPTEAPIVGARAIEAERARQMAARLEAAQRESVAELERARLAAQESLETERQRLAREREELDRIAAERAELARVAQEQIETERARLEAERQQAERLKAEKESAARAEAERIEAKRAEAARAEEVRLQAERAEAERQATQQKLAARAEAERAEVARAEAARAEEVRLQAERAEAEWRAAEQQAKRVADEQAAAQARAIAQAEADRVAAVRAEAERIQNERAEAERRAAEQHAARVADEQAAVQARAAVQAESDRAAVARAEASRLQAERVEAEREAELERKRVSKLRKAARKERERAEAIEREEMDRHARRAAERQARERAEEHVREATDWRRRDAEDRHQTEQSVRQEMARLEQEAHTRIETERAMRARAEMERDRLSFEQAERDRIAFEDRTKEREERERAQLEREEDQMHMTLRPMFEDDRSPAAPPRKPDSRPAAPVDDEDEDDPFDSVGLFDPDRNAPDDGRFLSPGGIVIVRAPRGPADHSQEDHRDDSAYNIAEPASVDVSADEPAPVDDEDAVPGRPSDAIVLGSVGHRLAVPAPARDAFRDIAFQRARRDAELSGARWFVLSAEHGLLEPQEWMSPDERAMTDIEPRHRAAWATWVVARLESLVGELPGQLIQVEAPGSIAAPVMAALRVAGAETVEGPITAAAPAEEFVAEEVDDISADEELVEAPPIVEGFEGDELEDDELEDEVLREPTPIKSASTPSVLVDDRPDAEVIPFVRAASVSEHLADPHQTMPAQAAASLPHHPGLYAWSVDHAGSRDLNRALRLPVRAGIIYVGQVGGNTARPDSGATINDHVTRVQLHGRARASTFRMTLATSLAKYLGLHTIEDPRLTEWMLEHLSIAVWPTEDVSNLEQLKSSVVDELAPALNVDRRHSGEYRDRLAELGGRLA